MIDLNLEIETHGQNLVADTWQIAVVVSPSGNSRQSLETMGFQVQDSKNDDLFYDTVPPDGWSKTHSGYWSYIRDQQGTTRFMMFYKAAPYDRHAFLMFSA